WESLKISNLKFSVIQTSGMSEQCEIQGGQRAASAAYMSTWALRALLNAEVHHAQPWQSGDRWNNFGLWG
ncbi:hypothetical protein QZL56_20960, partial [Providencia stuartii]|nr:hypothetical protein [Providencia stuartii]